MSTTGMKPVIIFVIGMLLSSFALADDPDTKALKTEIMKYTIEPCYLSAIRKNMSDVDVSEEDAMILMKLMMAENTLETTAVVLPLVKGKSAEQRQVLYEMFKNICINAGEA